MEEKQNQINRRNFLKTIGAAGLGSALTGVTGAFASAKADANESGVVDHNASGEKQEPKFPQVPRRKLGKTGVDVPCLSIGAMFNLVEKQILLRKAVQWGVTYLDTSTWYAGGNSELGIGKFISANPGIRKKLFIATKAADVKTLAEAEKRLRLSLKRMNTDYIDLYYAVPGMGMSSPADLTEELKQWVTNAKKQKLFRFFSFGTHKDIAQCLTAAARVGWVDVVMFAYNFRFMQDAKLQAAIEACYKAGIGLIAMKTQAWGQKIETEADKKLAGHFLKKGFTEGQAKVKAVLEDKRISSACVGMRNIALLTLNATAILDKTKLTQADKDVFSEYACVTCSGYCAGCAQICDSALPEAASVSDIMRYLMYYNRYGDRDRARELFAQIPCEVRDKLLRTDYRLAEARCPQHIPIGERIAEAVSKLA